MIRDDFAGVGGWAMGARALGRHDVIGVEADPWANATARAAGHVHLGMDVTAVPADALGPLDGYMGGPPCQPFSMTGAGAGRRALQDLLDALGKVATGASPSDALAAAGADDLDPRAKLVLHPMTVIRDALPTWVALEQVKPVLPVWLAYAEQLRQLGYHVAAGVLAAEQYGVPQTRHRAVLVAHRQRPVRLPVPTHATAWRAMRDVLPLAADAVLRSNYGTGGDPAKRGLRRADQPAPTITSKATRNRWLPDGRPMTVREAGQLQTFPADYPWAGPATARQLQVGNAIPPLLARAVLSTLIGD